MISHETMIYQRHRNPGASMDLIIPIHVTINTPVEVIHANVYANSRLPKEWTRVEPAHDRIAVICGSGPSMKDHLEQIASWGEKADVFSLNGSTSFLHNNGITPDFQVMADARERTADLIGPAKSHLFASQVHPVCFEKAPDARIWHFDNGEMETQLPPYDKSYALIGSAGSVGNCALGLAWAMGYRRFELYGYDSSHRDNQSHAFHQPLNDFEPYGRFPFNGKEYLCSYTMRSQADMFQLVAREIVRQGGVVHVHGDGILPDMWRENVRISASGTLEEREQHKYQLMWSAPEYRHMSPAEQHFGVIKEMLKGREAGKLIDFGCGTGRVLKMLESELNIDVLGIDFVRALEVDVPFCHANLWDLPSCDGDFGICCDVMEHIPPEKVDDVLTEISLAVWRGPVFFSISSDPDSFGRIVGEPLHVSLHPPEWWESKLKQFWANVHAMPGGLFICEPQGDNQQEVKYAH